MTDELPADAQALRMEIGRASLIRGFRLMFNEEPPDHIICNPHQLKRAGQEWCEHHKLQITLLAMVAQQTLNCLNEQGRKAAVESFTSSIITQSSLDRFMHNNPYLEELVVSTCRNTDMFRSLLTLLIDLSNLRL